MAALQHNLMGGWAFQMTFKNGWTVSYNHEHTVWAWDKDGNNYTPEPVYVSTDDQLADFIADVQAAV